MIKTIFDDSKQVYGSYRIKAELERQGVFISRPYVARLMKSMGLKSVLSKKFKVMTTDSRHDYPIAENILNRNFRVQELGKVWVSDITYIRVGKKWGYLTVVIDLADRKVVGWSLSDDMTYENTVLRAWVMARNNRKIIKGFVFHSDRGSQYACNKMRSIFSFQLKPAASELNYSKVEHQTINEAQTLMAYNMIYSYMHNLQCLQTFIKNTKILEVHTLFIIPKI